MSDSRTVKIIIAADVAQAIRGFQQVETGLKGVGTAGQTAAKQSSTFGDTMKKTFAAAGVVTGIAAVGTALKGGLMVGMQYEDALNSLKAVTSATGTEMKAAASKARELGTDVSIPATSAADAATAMLELSKGGLSVQQSMEAARGTLLLAAAAQVDGAKAAEIQVSALNTFSLGADQAGRVADTLANISNAASGEITDFAAGLQQSGTIAASFGWSLEETTTMLGLMANAGIRGSDAGTSLKTTLTQLLSPTAKQAEALDQMGISLRDSNGEMISAREFSEQLSGAKARLGDAEFTAAAATAFGTDAVRTALVAAAAGTQGYDKLADAVDRAGGAQELAAAKSAGLSGAFDKFVSTLEDVAIGIYEKLAPGLRSIVQFGTGVIGVLGDVVGWLLALPGPIKTVAAALGGWLLLRGPLTSLFNTVVLQGVMGFTRLGVAAKSAGALAGGLGRGLLGAFGGPVGLAITGVTLALSLFSSTGDEAAEVAEDIENTVSGLAATFDETTGAATNATKAMVVSNLESSGMLATVQRLGLDLDTFTDASMGSSDAQKSLATDLKAAAAAALSGSSAYRGIADDLRAAGISQEEFVAAVQSGDLGALNAKMQSYGESVARTSGNISDAQAIQNGLTAAIDEAQGPLTELGGVMGAAGANADIYQAAADSAARKTDAMGASADTAGASVEGMSSGVNVAATALEGFDTVLQAAADRMDRAAEAAKAMVEGSELSQELAAQATAAENASRAFDYLSKVQEEASKRNESLDEATANYTRSLESLRGGLKQATDAGTLNTKAIESWDVAALNADSTGQGLYDQLTSLAKQHTATTAAAYSNAIAEGDVKGANDKARAAATQSRDAFVKLMSQYLGGNVPAAQKLADELGILDGKKIDNKTFQTISDDAQARESFRQIEALKFQQKIVELTAIDNASYSIYNISSALAAMPSYKQVEIHTITTGARQAVEDGGVVHAASGLVVGGRGTSMVRNGAGAGLTWAEQATGKEYYLSMKPSMRGRNQNLASDAVKDLGGFAVFPGAGGMQGGALSLKPLIDAVASAVSTQRGVSVNIGQVGDTQDVRRIVNQALMTAMVTS